MLNTARIQTLLSLLALLLFAWPVVAATTAPQANEEATVEIEYPEKLQWAGVPISVDIVVRNASTVEPPVAPEIPGVTMTVRAGQESSMTTIINGRMSRNVSRTWHVQFTTDQVGTLELPKIRIVVDGHTYESRTHRVEVQKSDAGDLLSLEVTGTPDRPWIGQQVQATLLIRVKAFRTGRQVWDAESMWRGIDPQGSDWGIFKPAVEELYQRRRFLTPPRTEKNGAGEEVYVYELTRTVTPERTGPLQVGDVRVRMAYPLTRFAERPLVATLSKVEVDVQPLPAEGRPAGFNGAVGDFDIETSAKPTTVAAGDPVTLTITLIDRSRPGTDLTRLPAPPVAELPEVSRLFRVPADALAGTVNGRVKTFTQSLRPIGEHVTEIPSIAFTFFDPSEERYRTVQSRPIPLTVTPAERASTAALLPGAGQPAPRSAATLTEVEGGLLASDAVSTAMLASESMAPAWTLATAAAAPPLLAGLLVLWTRHRQRSRGDERRLRASRARRRALAALAASRGPAEVGAAIVAYLSDRSGRPAASLARRECTALLREADAPSALVERLDSLLAECERGAFASGAAGPVDDLARRARQEIDALERLRMSTAPAGGAVAGAMALAGPILWAAVLAGGATTSARAEEARTGAVAPASLASLESAQQAYEQAMEIRPRDPAAARPLFQRSADLYAAVAAEVDNASLFYNLGNSLLESGRLGEAIAAYLRALQLAPGDARVQANLAHARTLVADRFEQPGSTTLLENAASWRHLLSLSWRTWLAGGAWLLLWGLVAWRGVRPGIVTSEWAHAAWRISVAATAVVSVILGATVAVDLANRALHPTGVIVDAGVVVRKGNGEGFEAQFQESLGPGVEFRLLGRRPGWLEIQLPNGRGGWIREQQAQVI